MGSRRPRLCTPGTRHPGPVSGLENASGRRRRCEPGRCCRESPRFAESAEPSPRPRPPRLLIPRARRRLLRPDPNALTVREIAQHPASTHRQKPDGRALRRDGRCRRVARKETGDEPDRRRSPETQDASSAPPSRCCAFIETVAPAGTAVPHLVVSDALARRALDTCARCCQDPAAVSPDPKIQRIVTLAEHAMLDWDFSDSLRALCTAARQRSELSDAELLDAARALLIDPRHGLRDDATARARPVGETSPGHPATGGERR